MLPYQTTSRKEDGIVIVGLGGAGANILQRFSGSSAENVRLCIMSLDERLGRSCGNVSFLQLGAGMNHGLGSGGDPEMGRLAVAESRAEIDTLLKDARLLVMVVGLGGGTGSGVAPLLAEIAREAGIFLVSLVVMPFAFEGHRRRAQADEALETIARLSDIVFCFENDYMEDLFRSRSGAQAVFEEANSLLSQATASVPLLANSPGLINIGLDELVTALDNNDSRCIYGSGRGYGAQRAKDAAQAALESPMVAYHGALKHAHTVIVHIAGGNNMSLAELRTAMETIREGLGGDEVNIFFGAAVKPLLGEEIRVSLIASVDANELRAAILAEPEPLPPPPAPEETPEDEEAEEYAPEYTEEEEEEVDAAEESAPEDMDEEESGTPLLEPEEEENTMPPPMPPPPRRSIPEPRQWEFDLSTPPAPHHAEREEDALTRAGDIFGDDEEEAGSASSFYTPTPATARTARNINVLPKKSATDAEDALDARVRNMFNDEEEEDENPRPAGRYAPRRQATPNYNDLRDILPKD